MLTTLRVQRGRSRPLNSCTLSIAQAARWGRFVEAFCLNLGSGHLAGIRLGGLECDSKVNGGNRVAVAPPPYPLGSLLKSSPLFYCTIFIFSRPLWSITTGVPNVSLRLPLAQLQCPFFSPCIPLISLVLDWERFCHTESAQRTYKCPVALIKKVQDESPSSSWIPSCHGARVEGGDFQDTFALELFGRVALVHIQGSSGLFNGMWTLVQPVGFGSRKRNDAEDDTAKLGWNFQSLLDLTDKVPFSLMVFIIAYWL